MLSNRLAFLALAIGCLGAAAGGGYLATRQNTVPAPASAQAQTSSVPAPAQAAAKAPASTPTVKAVQETEGVVDTPSTPVPAAKASIIAKRADPPAHAAVLRESRPSTTVAHVDPAPALPSNFPVGTAAQTPAPAAPSPGDLAPAAPRQEERTVQEPVRPVEPPQHTFEELVVSADSVIGLQTETRVSSETARVEDRIEARVSRDVRVGGRVAIPAGARAIGSVVQVDRGGKFKERARLGVKFHTLVLADGTRISISTDPIYRDGEAPGNSSASKVGGAAVGGAILGAILGGGKGAAIGAAAGAGTGSAIVAAGDRNAATLPAGSPLTVRILQPVTITSDKN